MDCVFISFQRVEAVKHSEVYFYQIHYNERVLLNILMLLWLLVSILYAIFAVSPFFLARHLNGKF